MLAAFYRDNPQAFSGNVNRLMAGATVVANNLYRPARRTATEAEVARVAKLTVPLLALVCVWFTLNGGDTIVALLLMGYAFVTQLFPALILSLAPRNPATSEGAIAGIVAGVATVAVMSAYHLTLASLFPALPGVIADLNVGIVAMALNVAVLAGVSALTPARAPVLQGR